MAFTAAEQAAMRRALALAATPGVPLGPNPRVGCVLLDDGGATVAEGYHRGAGSPHAEADALAAGRASGPAVRRPWSPSSRAPTPAAPARARGRSSTPAYAAWCSPSPTPTRWPPGERRCSATAGSTSTAGCWSTRPGPLNRAWTFAIEHGRPFVTWKFATTLDGRSAAADGTSRWVTGRAARLDTHRLRALCDVMLVGTGTVDVDDPQLTVRDERRPAAAAHAAAAGRHGRARPRPPTSASSTTAPRRSHLRTRDPREALADAVRPRTASTSSSRAARPWPRRSSRPGSSTRSSRTSRRCCSAPASRPWATSESPPSPTRCVPSHRRDRAGTASTATRPTSASPCSPTKEERLMFTGIVEELGTVAGAGGPGRRHPAHRPRRARPRRRRAGRLDLRQRLLPHRRRARRRHLDRRRHARDARQDQPRRRRSRATASTSSARSPRPPGSAATSSRATSTASAPSPPARRASTGRSSRCRCRPSSSRYLVDKGSITVDGVCLTVVEARADGVHASA